MNRPTVGDGHIVMPEAEFELLLELAAERGARKALEDVGLDGDGEAGEGPFVETWTHADLRGGGG